MPKLGEAGESERGTYSVFYPKKPGALGSFDWNRLGYTNLTETR